MKFTHKNETEVTLEEFENFLIDKLKWDSDDSENKEKEKPEEKTKEEKDKKETKDEDL